jgi:hypothetical protein
LSRFTASVEENGNVHWAKVSVDVEIDFAVWVLGIV